MTLPPAAPTAVEIGRINAPFNGLAVLVKGGFRLYFDGSEGGLNDEGTRLLLGG